MINFLQRFCISIIFKFCHMLSRPPKLLTEENESQIYTETQRSKNSLSKNKVKKKESSLGGNRHRPISNASDNSNHSRSPQHQPQNNFDDIIRDNVSVGSHTSGKSRKNKKKETSLKSDRSNKVLNYKRQMQQSIKAISYGKDESEGSNSKMNSDNKNMVIDQSQVKNVPVFDSPKESPYKFMTKPNNNSRQTHEDHQTRKPFSEIDIDDEDDLPVIKIKQNQPKRLKETPKIAQRQQTRKLGQMFEENRRNLINAQPTNTQQNKSTINNNSQISDSFWQTSNIDNTSQAQSRRSKSKLGTLFKQKSKERLNNSSSLQADGSLQKSRDKSRSRKIFGNKNKNSSVDSEVTTHKNYPKKTNMEESGLPNQSKMASNYIGASKLVSNYIEPKKMDQSQDLFDGGDQSRSELNLSQSHQAGYTKTFNHNKTDSNINSSFNQKDSFYFNIQPEKSKKKGLGVVSKSRATYYQKQKQMVQITGQLVSVDLGNPKNRQGREMIKIPQVLQSKPIDTKSVRNKLETNLRENEKYLVESGFDRESVIEEEKISAKRKEQQLEVFQKRRKAQERERQRKQEEERHRALKEKQEYIKQRQEQFRREEAIRERKIKEQKEERERQKQKQIERKKREAEERQERERERQKQIERTMKAEKMKQLQQYERRQRELEQREKKLQQRENQMKEQHQRQLQTQRNKTKEQVKENRDISLSNLPSTYSRDHSSNGSQRSKSVKKNQKKESSINPIKKPNRKYFGDISPRGEQSFYEEDLPANSSNHEQLQRAQQISEPPKETMISKPKLISFSDDEDASQNNGQSKITNKFNTDVNFYENSIRVPSSKPPLSRKSVSSKGKSKPKESSISKKKPLQKSSRIQEQKKEPKKLTLIQLAMQKNYEPRSDSEYSQEGSQYSFGSREESYDGKNSHKSYGSKNSSRSQKKQSIIPKQKDSVIKHRPPPYRSKSSHQEEMAQIQSQRERMKQLEEEYDQPIVSKDCYYIDERGKLVKKDLIIKGNKIVSHPKVDFNPSQVYDRLRKSRQRRRSRSRDRSRERSLERSQVSNTMTSFQSNEKTNSNGLIFAESDAYAESACQSSQNFFGYANQNRQHFATMNYMGQKVQGRSKKNQNFGHHRGELPSNSIYSNLNPHPNRQQSATLNEFLKPIETGYTKDYCQQNNQNYGNNYSQQQQRMDKDRLRLQRKRVLQRTQKSASKRIN